MSDSKNSEASADALPTTPSAARIVTHPPHRQLPRSKYGWHVSLDGLEQFHTIKEAAALLNIKTWVLSRAVRSGVVPCHSLYNSRRLVLISEIVAAIKRQSGEVSHGG